MCRHGHGKVNIRKTFSAVLVVPILNIVLLQLLQVIY